MVDTISIIERLTEIETRMEELKEEAPNLARALDVAKASGNQAQIMLCQITMASRLKEASELLKEINIMEDSVKRSLGVV